MKDFIPDSEFVPDDVLLAQNDKNSPDIIPDDQFVPDDGLTDQQVVDRYLKSQKEFGTLPQQGLAFLEGAARGASLGASDFLAAELTSPEAVRARQMANPVSALGGNVAGAVGLDVLTGGAAAPAQAAMLAKGVSPLAARALAYGAEGALQGAATTVSDLALGDTKINAQKILTDVGFGAAIGGGLGLLSKGIEALPIIKAQAMPKQAIKAETKLGDDLNEVVDQFQKASSLEKTPGSIQELRDFNQQAQFMGMGFNEKPPRLDELDEAVARLPDLQVKPTELHKTQLGGKTEQDRLNSLLKKSPDFENDFNQYSANMRSEINDKTDEAIKSISPKLSVTDDAVEGGDRVLSAFKNQYQKEQDELIPLLKKAKAFKLDEGQSYASEVAQVFSDKLPRISEMFDTTADGISFKPYDPKWGLAKTTYSAVKDTIKSLQKGVDSIEDLYNLRKTMSQKVNVFEQSEASGQINALKSSFLDYIGQNIDDLAARQGGEAVNLANVLKRYAINEGQRETIEGILKTKIQDIKFAQIGSEVKEKLLGNLFKDSKNIAAAKNILSPEDFKQALADYMAVTKGSITKDGVVSSAKFGTILNDKKVYALEEAFKDQPQVLQRLKDLNTVARLVPDLPPANPSGTANTLMELVRSGNLLSLDALSEVKKYGFKKLEQGLAERELNQIMAQKAQDIEKVSAVKKIIEKTNRKIEEKVKTIFKKGRAGVASGITSFTNTEYNERVNRIKELNNATAMMKHFEDSTAALNKSVPNISKDINNTLIAGVQYLNSKIPQANEQFLFSKKYEPNKQEIYEFTQTFKIIDDPLSILDEVKNGTLSPSSMEAMKAVHPNLLQDLQEKMVEKLNPDMDLDYQTKLSISQFLETPLDQSMTDDSLFKYQMVLGQNTEAQKRENEARVTLGGMKQLGLDKNTETATDRSINDQG